MSNVPITILCCTTARSALAGPGEERSIPEGVNVVELPCSGRVDEVTILKTLREGAWAVVVIGCVEGNCKHLSGNYQARRRVDEACSLLQQIGVDPRRVRMCNIAPNQHAQLVTAVDEMRELAAKLGPIRILEGDR